MTTDEKKIMEALIDYLKERKSCESYGQYIVRYDRWIAWLKQGEPMEINPTEFDLRLNKLLKQFETLPKEELVNCLSFYLNVVQNDGTYKDEEKQGEQNQKHFELKAGHWYICHRAFCCRADHLTVKEGERFMCKQDGVVKGFVIKEPEKYFKEVCTPAPIEDEQKPDGSVGDETIRQDIENLIHFALEDGSVVSPAANTTKEDAISWIQSLKDRYTWKPSKEQMQALSNAGNSFRPFEEGHKVLWSLYNDLKKLREE